MSSEAPARLQNTAIPNAANTPLLPHADPWDESSEYRKVGAEILSDVEGFLTRFIAYPCDHTRVAHVLWIAHTHAMGAWESTPRLAFLSPEPGSGKSRALEVTELLVPRPMPAVNVTASYIFRSVSAEEGPPTILYDEVDTVFGARTSSENEDIRGLLNAGHRRGAIVGRCVVRGKAIELEDFPVYAAVALAGLGDLPDTILTRSIVVRMRRRAPNELVEPFRRRLHADEGEALRNRLASWAADVEPTVTGAWPDMPEGIADRNADVWEALFALADAAGGDWPARARVSAVTLVTDTKRNRGSLGIQLLGDLRTVFEGEDQVATETILAKLHKLDESPWGDLKGKPLDARGLARRLRPYDVRPTTIRQMADTAKGYRREDLHDTWERYLPAPRIESVTSVTSVATPCLRCAGDGCEWCG
jgi:hypothetical protein